MDQAKGRVPIYPRVGDAKLWGWFVTCSEFAEGREGHSTERMHRAGEGRSIVTGPCSSARKHLWQLGPSRQCLHHKFAEIVEERNADALVRLPGGAATSAVSYGMGHARRVWKWAK